MFPEYSIYLFVIFYGLYGVLLAPYYCSKFLVKLGNDERFWFVVLVLLNAFVLLFILLNRNFRKKLLPKEILIICIFIVIYLGFLFPIFFTQ